MNGPASGLAMPVARLEHVTQRYGRVAALDDVKFPPIVTVPPNATFPLPDTV